MSFPNSRCLCFLHLCFAHILFWDLRTSDFAREGGWERKKQRMKERYAHAFSLSPSLAPSRSWSCSPSLNIIWGVPIHPSKICILGAHLSAVVPRITCIFIQPLENGQIYVKWKYPVHLNLLVLLKIASLFFAHFYINLWAQFLWLYRVFPK